MLPENWEDIDIETMPLPESKSENKSESKLESEPESEPESITKSTTERKPRRRAKKPPPSKRSQRAKKKRKRKRKRHSSLKKFFEQEKTIVERKPIYTQHALERLRQGRSGKFITKKQGNAVVVVTILPSNGYARREMETIRVNRKQRSQKYKIR